MFFMYFSYFVYYCLTTKSEDDYPHRCLFISWKLSSHDCLKTYKKLTHKYRLPAHKIEFFTQRIKMSYSITGLLLCLKCMRSGYLWIYVLMEALKLCSNRAKVKIILDVCRLFFDLLRLFFDFFPFCSCFCLVEIGPKTLGQTTIFVSIVFSEVLENFLAAKVISSGIWSCNLWFVKPLLYHSVIEMHVVSLPLLRSSCSHSLLTLAKPLKSRN